MPSGREKPRHRAKKPDPLSNDNSFFFEALGAQAIFEQGEEHKISR